MKKKFVYGIAAVVVASTAAMAVADEEKEMTLEERVAALEAGNKKSDWTERIKFKGDFRYRFENRDSDAESPDPLDVSDKSRHRIRARIGAYGDVNDQVDFGVRIATGSDESPTSTNQDIDGYGSKKEIWLDLAYITLNCQTVDGFSATFGKMKQPWVTVSDLVYDTDLNPEGISTAYELPLEQIVLMLQAGHFILDENTGDDVQMTSGQIAGEATVADGIAVTAGVNAFIWNNAQDAVVGAGNTGAVDFEIVEGFAQVDLKNTPLPIKLFADCVQNIASDVDEDTAWMVGAGTKVGKASFSYNYRDIDPDAIYGNWADSDFHDGGTGGSGHKLKAAYALMKNLSAGATYFITETEAGNDVNTLQLDLVAKF